MSDSFPTPWGLCHIKQPVVVWSNSMFKSCDNKLMHLSDKWATSTDEGQRCWLKASETKRNSTMNPHVQHEHSVISKKFKLSERAIEGTGSCHLFILPFKLHHNFSKAAFSPPTCLFRKEALFFGVTWVWTSRTLDIFWWVGPWIFSDEGLEK